MPQGSSAGLVVTTPSDREIVMTRIFDAPRQLVFDAWTKPEHLVHWYGAKGWTLTTCEIDLRPGGVWRFVMQGPNGAEMGVRGIYREIVPPERIISTESYDDFEEMGGETINTLTFEEADGKTTVTSTVRYQTREDRDAILRTPMERGVAEGFDALEAYLRKLQQ